jgi:hypothetical protein
MKMRRAHKGDVRDDPRGRSASNVIKEENRVDFASREFIVFRQALKIQLIGAVRTAELTVTTVGSFIDASL